MPKPLPEKCRLCAKLTATQAKQLHGVDRDGCWGSTVCPSRRCQVRLAPSGPHALHRDRRNQARNLKRWQEQGRTITTWNDLEIAQVQEQPTQSAQSFSQIQDETQLPNLSYSAASVSAVGGCPNTRCRRRDLVEYRKRTLPLFTAPT